MYMKELYRKSYSVAKIVVFSLVATLASLQSVTAQERVDFLPESSLTIAGDSNLSEWTVTADSLYGWVEYAADDQGNPVVSAVELHVISRQIKSNKSPIMDRLMYRALNADEHEEIVFDLTGARMYAGNDTGSFTITATGNLSMAGITHEINVEVEGTKTDGGGYRFAGSHEIKMTDYGMKPPTALFGSLHTRDDCTVRFEFIIGSF